MGLNCSGRRAVEPGSGRERAGSLPRLPTPPSLLLLVLSPVHVPGTHPGPSPSDCSGKRESLPARGARASNKPVSTPTRQMPGEPVNRSRMKIPAGRLAPCSDTTESHSCRRPGSPRARKSSPSHLQRRPECRSCLTQSSGFFLNNSAQGH